jgi:hypothetical protein
MSKCWKGRFATRIALKSFALAVGIWPAFAGVALSQQQNTCMPANTLGWTIDNPSLDVQRAITDVLSSYAWTIDDRNAAEFVKLFVRNEDAYYQLCNRAGTNQVYKLTFDNEDPTKDLEIQMPVITQFLITQALQTRHLVTNTLFDKVDDQTVRTKSTVLVTIQAASYEAPDLDYSADVRATLVLDEKDGKWKFQDLTVYADNAPSFEKKR